MSLLLLRPIGPIGSRRGFGGGTPYVIFDGTDTLITVSDAASIQDIQDGVLQAEAWVKFDSYGENNLGRVFDKTRWDLNITAAFGGVLYSIVDCATTNAETYTSAASFTPDGLWHHVLMSFDDAGDRKIYIAIDGTWQTYTAQTAGVDAITSDVGLDLALGNATNKIVTLDGALGWCRISDNARETVGVNFTPPARDAYPTADGNTVGLWKMNEGSGSTAADSSGNSNDGAITDGEWGS